MKNIIRFSDDLLKCKDYIEVNKNILLNDEVFSILGYFPYETAGIYMPFKSRHHIRRSLLFALENELNNIGIHQNKYVVVICDSDSIVSYFFHDNTVCTGQLENITGYACNELKLKK